MNSSLGIEIEVSKQDLKAINKGLGRLKSKAPIVLARVINSAASATRAKMGNEANNRYRIRSTPVKDTVSITKASRSNLRALVTSKSSHLEIKKYYALSKKAPPKAAIKKGGMKPLDGDPKAFMATMTGPHGGTHTAAFQRYSLESGKAEIRKTRKSGKKGRVTKHNVKIHEYFGPAVPSILKNKEIMHAIEERVGEVLEKRIKAEVNNILRKE